MRFFWALASFLFFFLAARVTGAPVALDSDKKTIILSARISSQHDGCEANANTQGGQSQKEKKEKKQKKNRRLVTVSDSRPLIAESSGRDGAQICALPSSTAVPFFFSLPPRLRQTHHLAGAPAVTWLHAAVWPDTPGAARGGDDGAGGVRQGADSGPYFRTPASDEVTFVIRGLCCSN